MNRNSEGGIDLTSLEVHALAVRVIAGQLADYRDWLGWEDYPQLSEAAFEDLTGEVANWARNWHERSCQTDRTWDIDSAHIVEVVS